MTNQQKTTRPAKKKHFVLLGRVKDFFREQSEEVKHE